MRVLIVTGIFPPDIGGPATFVPQLGRALTERGWTVRVATSSDSGEASQGQPFDIVRIPRRLPIPRRWAISVRTLGRLAADADVVFVNGLALEAMVTNLFARKPVVMKIVGDFAWERSVNRGWITDDFETFQRKRYSPHIEALKSLRLWWVRRARRVIVPSHYLARWVASWGVVEDRIAVVHNAVDTTELRRPPLRALPANHRVATVGRLVRWKHIDRIVQVLAQIDDAGLIVVGEGPERARLETLARSLKVDQRVLFTGALSRAETLGVVSSSDLVILNSSYEGFSHVIVEALSLGVPVVATTVGGTPEILEDGVNGRMVRPMDNAGLKEAVSSLLASEEERARLAAGAVATARRFNHQQMVEDIDNVLHAAARS